jgi:hypothetical protein
MMNGVSDQLKSKLIYPWHLDEEIIYISKLELTVGIKK